MTADQVLSARTFPRSLDIVAMVEISLDQLRPPDFRLRLLSSVGDAIFVQVVDGTAPLQIDTVVYVQHRGPYEIARREAWPGDRWFLTLTAWPRR